MVVVVSAAKMVLWRCNVGGGIFYGVGDGIFYGGGGSDVL